MEPEHWVALAVAALTGRFVGDVLAWLKSFFTGRRASRRSELDRAWAAVDEQSRRRRIAEEFASHQTRRLIEAPCIDPATVARFPNYHSKEKPHD